MKFTSVFVLLAAALVSAEDTTEATTTVTSTFTKTMTITHCGPEVPDCPYSNPTTTTTPIFTPSVVKVEPEVEKTYPAHNTTVVHPTGGFKNSTAVPTWVTATSTAYVDSEPTEVVKVPESGSSGLYVSSGMLLGVVAAGALLL